MNIWDLIGGDLKGVQPGPVCFPHSRSDAHAAHFAAPYGSYKSNMCSNFNPNERIDHWVKGGARMTAQSTEVRPRTVNEPVDVRFSSSGAPLAMRWRGRIWQTVGEPVSWSSFRSWWEPGNTPVNGQGGLITTQS